MRASVSTGNQSLKSYGWNFGETNLNRPKNLELLIEPVLFVDTPTSLRNPACTNSCSKNVSLPILT